MENRYVKIHLLDNPFCIDEPYTYFVPHELSDIIVKGTLVAVPFGKSEKLHTGLVVEDRCADPGMKTKSVLALISEEIRLGDEEIGLCNFMREHTLCTVGDAVHSLIPAGAISAISARYSAVGNTLPEGKERAQLFESVLTEGAVTLQAAIKKFGPRTYSLLRSLCEEGYLKKEIELKRRAVGKEKKYYVLDVDDRTLASLLGVGEPLSEAPRLRSDGHRAILALLSSRGRADAAEIKADAGVTDAQISAVLKKGYIKTETESFYRNPYAERSAEARADRLSLSEEQEDAYRALEELLCLDAPSAALLHGVTGSGKTMVMMKLIDRTLARGEGVIMLIPEIALTPQTVDRFCSRYGSRVAIIHSSLTQGERLDAFMKIRRGEADVVIGTRSAVFAPVKNLGLIIIDEEHEHTYKSDNNPKYHARDIARFRCAKNNALMLLASATPSIESYKKALDGAYRLVELKSRYGGAVLPEVRLVDMRSEIRRGNVGTISEVLADEIGSALHRREQSIIFLNRRGYRNRLVCMSCGEPVTCENCSVPMTYHTDRTFSVPTLVCHWCGAHTQKMPKKCTKCQGTHLKPVGSGIQHAQKQIGELFTGANIIRMDTDTAYSRAAYEQILSDFREGRADILVGTQMVTKGHDFPRVTLVGVLNADSSLYLDDYRANERTFSLLTQVIGRAGRGERPGLALIQTVNPDNDVILRACAQDYRSFYDSEIVYRQTFAYPPFCDIVTFTMSGEIEEAVVRDMQVFAKKLFGELGRHESEFGFFKCYGPIEAPVYRVDGKFRLRIIIKCKLNHVSRAIIARIYRDFTKRKNTDPTLSADINPSSV